MENIEYANAYSEVLEIIKYIPKEEYTKIPRKKIELFETKSNKDYKFSYNPEKTLDEQNVSKRAKAIIAILFRDYWATDTQREKKKKKKKYDILQLDKMKQEKNNSNDILKKRDKKYEVPKENINEYEIKNSINSNLPIEVKEKSIYIKMINLFKKISHIIFN